MQSRYYDPAIGRFINADKFVSTGQGILGNNMFAYCLNNPVCMADYNGYDAIYVVDYKANRGLPVVGHSIVFLQNASGDWYKTQYAGVFPYKSTAAIEVVMADMTEINAMVNNETIEDVEYVYLSGDFSKSLAYAEKNSGENYGGYNLLKNSCFHYARDTLLEGTFDNDLEWSAILRYTGNVPSGLYNHLSYAQALSAGINKMRSFFENVWEKITSWL